MFGAPLLLGGWGVLLFILERAFPATPAPLHGGRRLIRNLALGALVLAVSPLIQLATAHVMGGVRPLIAVGGGPALIVGQIVALDLWAYALHRAYHRVPLMWRLHGAHHLDAHLDVTSAVRFHVGEVLLSSLLRLIPLFLLGISIETNLLYGAILSASAMFHHSNLRLPRRFEALLSTIIVTPSIHWVHHHAVQRDTDANYASLLSIWDRIFASASPTVRTPAMLIGVEGAQEKPLGALLLHPFD
jgi:sterol desaturase/sphingolipid hydroxylase (fatty acid hydroxylase superfamily)